MDSLSKLTNTEALGIGGILGAMLATFFIVVLVWYVLQIIAYWKIFTKAGEPGWKSIIPVYNSYIQYKLTWKTSKFWILLGSSFVLGFGESLMEVSSTAVSLVGSLMVIIAGIIVIVYSIKEYIYLAKAYGKGIGFILGLIFLNPIFVLILGFGSSKYEGNKS